MKTVILTAAVALYAIAFPANTMAGDYPTKPIRMIVPYPPGGGTDIISRVIGHHLTERLGSQIVIENRGGAGGTIGMAIAAGGQADGYTLVMGQTSNLAIGPSLYKKLPYDPLRSFAPVSLVDSAPLALSVATNAPYRSVRELIDASKKRSDSLNFASPGNGTVAHLTGELLKRVTGMQFVHVPYKGAAQAIPDLIAGRADFYISSLESAKPHMQSGKVRVLAVTSVARAPDAPDIPTIAEAGYPGFEASTWWGILTPAGTPASVIQRLDKAIEAVLRLPEVNRQLGGDKVETGPAAFGKLLKTDYAKWAEVVKSAGLMPN